MSAISGISSALFNPSAGAARRGQGAGGETSPPGTPAAEKDLSKEQQTQLRELKKTDAEVRTHEQAHKTAGGPYTGAIQLEYTTGPDGRRYATAGEVPIDASPVRNNPEATVTKMEVVKRAALAPQAPSPQDRAVAAQADATKAQAQTELRQSRDEGGSSNGTPVAGSEATGGAGVPANEPASKAAARYRQAASLMRPVVSNLLVSA